MRNNIPALHASAFGTPEGFYAQLQMRSQRHLSRVVSILYIRLNSYSTSVFFFLELLVEHYENGYAVTTRKSMLNASDLDNARGIYIF